MIAEARSRVARMDGIDRSRGFATPEDVGVDEEIATARMALECAIKTRDWAPAADAFVMLDALLARLRA